MLMRCLVLILIMSLPLWSAESLQASTQAIPHDQKKILLLYSYGDGGKGVGIFSDAFSSVMNDGGFSVNDLYFEYLDLERNREDKEYRQHLRSLLLEKYSRKDIGLIITVQQPALDFLLKEGRELSPDAPAITIQAPLPGVAETHGRRIVSQLARFDIGGTLKHALAVFPQTQKIMFITGSSEADKRMALEAEKASEPWRGKLTFETNGDTSLDHMLLKVARLPPHSVIIFTQYNRDGGGQITVSYEVEGRLVKAANAPVFGLYDYNLINGGIGGSVVSVKALGENTGQTALNILSGKLPITQPVISLSNPVMPMFDWTQIQRWGGSVDQLPKDSIFVNRQSTLWEEHHGLIVGAMLVLLLQTLTIAGLMVNRKHRMKAESLLAESESRYRARLDVALEHKRQYEEGLELLLKLNQQAMVMTEKEICDHALDIAVKTTRSNVGYLHKVNDAQDTISLFACNFATPQHGNTSPDAHYPVATAGIWADCARTRQASIHNDYQNIAGQTDNPFGHVHLIRHMSLPVLDGNMVRMTICVANKTCDYDQEDCQQLQLVANEVQKILLRRRAEDALHESEERFRFITDLSPGLIWVSDTNKLCTWFNRTWLEFTGRSMEQELGSGWMEGVHPDEYASCMTTFAGHFDQHRPFAMEYRLRRQDGEYRWLLAIGHPRLGDAGEFKGYVGYCLDITERKRAEQALVESEKRFGLFMDTLPAAAFIKDEAGNTLYVNRYMANLIGARAWVGKSTRDLFAPELANKMIADDRHTLTTGYLVTEEQVPGPDGRLRVYQTHKFSIPRHGQPSLLGGIALDITEHKTAVEQLRKLSLAVEQSPESIVITNLAGEIEYVNRAFLQTTGYDREEVIGRNPRFLQSSKTPEKNYVNLWNALTQGKSWQGEFHNLKKNGEIYIESARISPVRQADGQVTHYLAVKADITESKRAADSILESKLLLQRVIDSTPDWVYVKDRKHHFKLVNQRFAEAFDQTPEAMIGRYDSDFMPLALCEGNPAEAIPGLHDDDDRVLHGQFIHLPCEKILFKNGEVRVFDTFKAPLRDSSQSIYGILCYRRDITERFNKEQEQQALERQLLQAQKMELIGHLTGGIAHDFNNILASMLGFAEILQLSSEINQSPKLNRYLQEILQAGIRAKELVAQLLTFSHRRDAASEAIMIAPIVKEVEKLLRSTLPTTISIKTDVTKGLPEVLISPVQLHQILMNLGVNARDAIAGRGTITITAKTVALSEVSACASCHKNFLGSFVMLSVRDSGTGIPPEHQPKIFDPFFTTKDVGKGSGLGLSVLHGIVHSANGHIEVFSEPGQGTEFRIYLPAQQLETAAFIHDANLVGNPAPVSGHVMVVDDEESIVGFMTTLLENLGCRVTGLTSAAEALRLFKNDPDGIDLVITDQSMPELTGAELASTMLACRSDLPVILCTGYSNAITEETARQIGIRRFLIKPIPAKVFADVVGECLVGKPAGADPRERV